MKNQIDSKAMDTNEQEKVPPWRNDRAISSTKALLYTTLLIVSYLVLIIFIFIMVLEIIEREIDLMFFLLLILLIADIYGIKALTKIIGKMTVDFKPKKHIYESSIYGKPFQVAYFKSKSKDSYGSISASEICFSEEELRIKGVKDVKESSAKTLGCLFGVIGALIASGMNKPIDDGFSYTNITVVSIEGRRLTLAIKDNDEDFYVRCIVSSMDGERLYRELHAHFPRAVEEWANYLI